LRKRGKLNLKEEEFIRQNVGVISIEEIAVQLNRKAETVLKYIQNNKLVAEKTKEEIEDDKRLRTLLRSKAYWPSVKNSLFDDEVKDFEDNWVAMVRQFGEDILHGEELNLKRWLILEIQATRCLQAQKKHMEQIRLLEDQLELEQNKDDALKDVEVIAGLIEQVTVIRASLSQHSKTYKDIQTEIKFIVNLIKATREEKRDVKVNQDTYWGYIEMLQNEKFMKQESKMAELLKISQKKAKDRMSEYHKFCDDTVDRVLLNADTVMED